MDNKLTIDLNCDLGEGFGVWSLGNDEAIMPYVSSVNIACGFHAGDPSTMMKTIALAVKHEVHIGAHPGFPDLVGFGRREMKMSTQEVYDMLLYQIGALKVCAEVQGAILHHVKPHGALYNMAARDRDMADAIVDAIYAIDKSLILYGLAGSELVHSGERKGLRVYNEVFADRTYQSDGSLSPRTKKGALLLAPQQVMDQVLQILQTGRVTAVEGVSVSLKADTICLHGDNENTVVIAKFIYEELQKKNIQIR